MFFISHRKRIGEFALVFFLSAAFFSFFQQYKTFPDPDSFYHAKMGALLSEGTVLHEFPWLSFTILRDRFVDHHFLYHLLLVPFIRVAGPLLGTTIATIFFASLVIVVFHWLLRRFAIRYAPLFTLLLCTTGAFIFRMNLAKASSLSVVFFLLLLWVLWERRAAMIFFLAFFYVWLFDGWPLALLASAAVLLGTFIASRATRENTRVVLWKPFVVTIAGLIVGIVVNPYFPANVSFFWSHIGRIALLRPFNVVPLGMEWGALAPLELFNFAPVLFISGLIFSVLFFLRIPEATADDRARIVRFAPYIFSTGLLAGILFVATLTARRHAEYFIPIATLFLAFLFTSIAGEPQVWMRHMCASFLPRRRFLRILIIVYFVAVPSFLLWRDMSATVTRYRDGYSWNRYRGVAEYLRTHTDKGTLVFNSRWDDFPMLFYWGDWNRYIVGLDPTFLYLFDRDAYERFTAIVRGEGDLQKGIAQFGAHLFLVSEKDKDLLEKIKTAGLPELYHDSEAHLYAI
ncbi:MAG: hypothetical protein Q7S16_01570 [bacterium]|nr:hypothetical protein [bacterium]